MLHNPGIEVSGLSDAERMYSGDFTGNSTVNNDPILRAKSKDLCSLYAPLLNDAQVFSTLQQRISATFARPITVTPADDSAEAQIVAEKVKSLLSRDDIDKACRQLLQGGIFYGFNPAEILWKPDGKHFAIDAIKVRKPHRFAFDRNGDLLLKRLTNEQIALAQDKFLILRAGDLDSDSPYGRGLGYQLFWPVQFKLLASKWLARLGEGHAMPTVVIHYPNHASDDDKKMAMEAIKAIHNGSRIALPEGMAAQLIEAASTGVPLKDQLGYYDKAISKIIVGQTMTTDDGASKSQAQVHQGVGDVIFKSDSKLLDAVLQQQLIDRYVAANWPTATAPRIARDWSEEEDRNERATHDKILHDMGITVRDDRIAERYGDDFERTQIHNINNDARVSDDGEVAEHAEIWEQQTSLPLVDGLEKIQAMLTKALGFEDFEARLPALYSELSGEITQGFAHDPAVLDALRRAILNAFVAGAAGVDNIHDLMISDAQFTDSDGVDYFSLPDKEAAQYLRNKGFRYSFHHTDWYGEAHARAFTVAKMIDLDLLSDTRQEIIKAIANGTTFAEFKNTLIPKMQKRGWWGQREVINPETGEIISAKLGSNARLETIFRTNISSAHAHSAWQRIQATKADFPYLRYFTVGDSKVRDEHVAWHGVVLPVDHAFWRTHYPPNGYRCRCWVMQVSHARLEAEGWTVSKSPRISMRNVKNRRTGEMHNVPKGIAAGFEHNAGIASRSAPRIQELSAKIYQDPSGHDVAWWNRFGAGLPLKFPQTQNRPASLPKAANTEEAWQNWLSAAQLPATAHEIHVTDALGVRVVLTERLVRHLRGDDETDERKRVVKVKEGRDQDYHSLIAAIRNPDEIWLAPLGKNQHKLRQRYLKTFTGKSQTFVVERDESGHVAITSYALPERTLQKLRLGYPVYKKE